MQLYDPAEHRPLDAPPWSEAAARTAAERIATDAIAAYRGVEQLWPNAPEDLEGEADRPFRNAYLGAAGLGWALHTLANDGLAPPFEPAAELAATLPERFRADAEFPRLAPPPAPSLLFGECGVLLAAHELAGDRSDRPDRRDELEACIARNADNPTLELCWGSPGTMQAALRLYRASGDERWRRLWLASAEWLLEQWTGPIWVGELYGQKRPYTGAGHGFAGTAGALLAGVDLLGDSAAATMARIADGLRELATEHDALAQWFPLAGAHDAFARVQWCHGSPGFVTSLSGLPADPDTDRLLLAGGELTWTAGPLRKGVGLCHGTAGNAYAFLALHARSGDERWLHRAQAFAMDAAGDVERRRAAAGHGRYSLFTGDIGVALLISSCLRRDPAFPLIDPPGERSPTTS